MSLGRAAGLSDTGRRRRHNEDAYVLQPPVFAVADGMGGAQAGELASRLATETVRQAGSDGDGVERVASLIQAANRRVYERSREDSAASGMGTTMTVALVEGGRVSIGHVGDSRAYLIRDGTLQQVTDDHSLVSELMRSGKLTREEADQHPQRSVITRVLGTDPEVDVDTYTVEAVAGDVFLLCSDGLNSMVGDETILRIVEDHRDDLDAAARALVRAANRSGGEDNVTVVFFDIAEVGSDADETRRLSARAPSSATAQPEAEEETLSEMDRIPAIDTAVLQPVQVQRLAEGEPERSLRRAPRLVATLAGLLGLLVVAAIVVWALWG